jgi:hypothetical protein
MGRERGAGGLVSAWRYLTCADPFAEALAEFGVRFDDQFAPEIVGQIMSLGNLGGHSGETLNLLLHASTRDRRS